MAKIASIYSPVFKSPVDPCTMDTVRWLRISEGFSRLGHEVDIILNCDEKEHRIGENIRYVASRAVKWDDYDVIKTFFHRGFQFLEELGGDDHPFIISKLGSVVGKHDDVEGVYFFEDYRQQLFEVQEKIARKSRYVTVLTPESAALWKAQHGLGEKVLLLPTGVDAILPPPSKNPYRDFDEKIAVYIGNLYNTASGQRQVNLLWQNRLSRIGGLLKDKGIRLVVIGPGETDVLDMDSITYLGRVNKENICDYEYFADAGLVLAQGEVQHNESSKIYEYLRAGLPVVSESPVPNNHVIEEAHLGFVADFLDDDHMARLVERAVDQQWDTQSAINYMLKNHTWDHRVVRYHEIISNGIHTDIPR